MALTYAYNYAELDLETNMCVGVQTRSNQIINNPIFVEIPVYDEEYICKYYINGAWYEDAEGTIPWTSVKTKTGGMNHERKG